MQPSIMAKTVCVPSASESVSLGSSASSSSVSGCRSPRSRARPPPPPQHATRRTNRQQRCATDAIFRSGCFSFCELATFTPGASWQGKARQGKEGKARQGKARQGKARQGKYSCAMYVHVVYDVRERPCLAFSWSQSVSLRAHILISIRVSARPPRSAIHSVPNFIAQQKHPPQCGQWSSGAVEEPAQRRALALNRPAPKPARTSAGPALTSPVLSSSHFLLPPRPPLRLCALTALA